MLLTVLVVLFILFITLAGLAKSGKVSADWGWFLFGAILVLGIAVFLSGWGVLVWKV